MKLIVIDDTVYIGSANFDAQPVRECRDGGADRGSPFCRSSMRGFVDRRGLRRNYRRTHKARAGWLTRLRWTLAWSVVGMADYTVPRRLNFCLLNLIPSLTAVSLSSPRTESRATLTHSKALSMHENAPPGKSRAGTELIDQKARRGAAHGVAAAIAGPTPAGEVEKVSDSTYNRPCRNRAP